MAIRLGVFCVTSFSLVFLFIFSRHDRPIFDLLLSGFRSTFSPMVHSRSHRTQKILNSLTSVKPAISLMVNKNSEQIKSESKHQIHTKHKKSMKRKYICLLFHYVLYSMPSHDLYLIRAFTTQCCYLRLTIMYRSVKPEPKHELCIKKY